MSNPTREQAWETLTRYTKSESLLRHALAVEASTALRTRASSARTRSSGASTALLHDFDYEIHPTLDKHPQDGAPILREEGYPEVVIEGVLSHAEHLAMPRDTPLKKTLFACDELSGLRPRVRARPARRASSTLEPKSVRKKLKQPSFAAGVHRDEVYAGAELLGVELDEHIAQRDRGAAARSRASSGFRLGRLGPEPDAGRLRHLAGVGGDGPDDAVAARPLDRGRQPQLHDRRARGEDEAPAHRPSSARCRSSSP